MKAVHRHHHPKGQTLYVTDGIGLVAARGGGVQEIRPGDVVYTEPGEEHWHGATPDRFMAHLAMQEADASWQVVTWLDHDRCRVPILNKQSRAPRSGRARTSGMTQAAVEATVARFGRLDVLVNNAGSFNAGFFQEMTPEDFRAQIETTFFGPVNVTRAALPRMRQQGSGLVMTISSTAGIAAEGDFVSAYAASKFAVEGWMEGIGPEVAPFGIKTMLVEPGFFNRVAHPQSTKYAEASIADYADRTTSTVEAGKSMEGKQSGDPAKLAKVLIQLAALDEPPVRFAAGADAVALFEKKAHTLLGQAGAHRELSSHMGYDD